MDEVSADLLERLERELVSYIYERYLQQRWDGRAIPKDLFRSFVAHARSISDSFTVHRNQFKGGYFRSKEGRAAYFLYFHLANMVRTFAVLREISRRKAWPSGPLRVLDVGSGSAPSLWAASLAAQGSKNLIEHMIAVDQEEKILRDAKELWSRAGHIGGWSEIPFYSRQVRFSELPQKLDRSQYDVILFSNLINEMASSSDEFLVQILGRLFKKHLRDGGLLVMVEPALQVTSRHLTSLRDRFLSTVDCEASFPCGHNGKCPLNREPRDWCHFEVSWNPPPIRKRIEKVLGHQSGSLKFSYLVFQHSPSAGTIRGVRVLSDSLSSPAGDRLLLCQPERKVALCFNRKEKGVGTLLHSCRRGDLLELEPSLLEDLESKRIARYAREIDVPPHASIRRL